MQKQKQIKYKGDPNHGTKNSSSRKLGEDLARC